MWPVIPDAHHMYDWSVSNKIEVNIPIQTNDEWWRVIFIKCHRVCGNAKNRSI